ncbi:dienelactone hydrolase family protein [Lysobacter sp. M2-1]|uniref:dienelactone hydrolase family protein n=1 Tax=Lysobacter sp. M2-1 TaxID=2916839 RepID=UPI001F59F182|nr:dienelactone hydrolase family protein [Lysobacter sp. M2-1]
MSDMPRPTARDFDPEVLRLFDQYVHGDIDRRGFLSGTARIAGGMAAATGLLAMLAPQFAAAQQVKPDDPRIATSHLDFDSPDGYGKARGYLARPARSDGKLPVVLVIHENRGLNPHIEDVARRLAVANFIAFAPDALFPLGGYPGDEDKARAEFAKLDQAKSKQDFLAAARFAKKLDGGNGRLGVVGFCWGGGMSHWLATQLSDLDAAAPFYGPAPAPEEAKQVKAELLVVLAETDERVNATWPPYEAALKAAKLKYAVYQPDGTQHGFHNDTTPRYDAAAAREAWKRTLALFERTLR